MPSPDDKGPRLALIVGVVLAVALIVAVLASMVSYFPGAVFAPPR
jgi:hypothetical protein